MTKIKNTPKNDEAKAKKVARLRQSRAEARDVGVPPKVPPYWRTKRKRAAGSLLEFCKLFLPQKFFLAFSPDHLRVIAKLEQIVRHGGLLALAMPRGSGKSELVKAAAVWAILFGHRRFVVIVGATAGDAIRIMGDIKATLATNDAINSAFPEATYCIRDLNNNIHRSRFQTINGQPSGLEWKNDAIRLAFVPKATCAGAVIRTAGLTGAIRGMTATGPKGETVRPDLVLCDDPQDRESATSPAQTEDRERIIRGDVLGLAGPTKSIACFMPCTVITENDLADRFLNRELNPQWNGERTQLVESFPTNEKLWGEYFQLRADDFRAGGDGRIATEFYRKNREAMDAGGRVAWPERYDAARYASALEEALVRRHDDPEAFAAEMQNDPIRADAVRGEIRELRVADLVSRVNGLTRGTLPTNATHCVGFIDVGKGLLWWGIVAWNERFDGVVIDYGSFPHQPREYFTQADARPTLADMFPGRTEGQMIYAGLRTLTSELLSGEYPRDGEGTPCPLQRILIDAGWLSESIYQFIRESPHRSTLVASKGYATSSNTRAMDDWPRRENERVGPSWRYGVPPSGRGYQLLFDPDYWKSFLADRLTTPPGSGGCLQFFGEHRGQHRLLADHLTAEYATRISARGRTFDKWDPKPGGAENHFLDVITGCCVAASFGGLAFNENPDGTALGPRPRKKVKLSDLFYAKHGYR